MRNAQAAPPCTVPALGKKCSSKAAVANAQQGEVKVSVACSEDVQE